VNREVCRGEKVPLRTYINMPRKLSFQDANTGDRSGASLQSGRSAETGVFSSILFAPAQTPGAPRGDSTRTASATKAPAQQEVGRSLAHLSLNPGPSALHTAPSAPPAGRPDVQQSSLIAPTAPRTDRSSARHTSHRSPAEQVEAQPLVRFPSDAKPAQRPIIQVSFLLSCRQP
jgi:hypothetical protein